jgi:hypothetical protein
MRQHLLWVLLNHFDVVLDHSVRLRVQGCGAHLAQSQALQNLLYQIRLKEEAGNQRFRHCRSLLIRNAVGFWPLGKIIYSNQEVCFLG